MTYHVASAHLDILAVPATESQVCSAGIDTQHFMRCAVVMRKGIDTISPQVRPIVLRETQFKNGRRIFGVGCDYLSIKQQGKGTIWENTIVFEIQLLRLDKILLLDHGPHPSINGNARGVDAGLNDSEISLEFIAQ